MPITSENFETVVLHSGYCRDPSFGDRGGLSGSTAFSEAAIANTRDGRAGSFAQRSRR
jgi:hypothetical protein